MREIARLAMKRAEGNVKTAESVFQQLLKDVESGKDLTEECQPGQSYGAALSEASAKLRKYWQDIEADVALAVAELRKP